MAVETVTVACKHPHGLILRLHEMVEVDEPSMGGSRVVKRARQVGEAIKIAGYSIAGSKVPPPATTGAFALTPGVPKDFWDAWVKQNKDLDMLEKGLIFAAGTSTYVADKAKERQDMKSGFEPLDPEKLPLAGVRTYEKAN